MMCKLIDFKRYTRLLLYAAVAFSGAGAWAERGMVTDRPDKTEGPYTVEKGRFQIEAGLISHSSDEDGASETTEQVFGDLMLKMGVTDAIDVHIRHEAFVKQESEGSGDTEVRLKWNLFGNESEDVLALALLPYVKLPTGDEDVRNRETEYGLIVPMSTPLPNDFSLGWMLQLAREKNETNDDLYTTYVASVSLGRDLSEELGGYLELYQEMADEEGARVIATFDVGLTYEVKQNLQIDAGVNFGITQAAEDYNPFLGISALF